MNFNRVFHYKPSILGVFPLFLETPIYRYYIYIYAIHCHIIFNVSKILWQHMLMKHDAPTIEASL